MPQNIEFEKMHGAGNDFVVMDARPADFPFEDVKKRTPDLCHRKTGIGADGILMLGRSQDYDYTMHYLNADGSEAGMCGNGARCLAGFAVQQGLPKKLKFQVRETVYRAEVHNDYVSVHFPVTPEPVWREIEGKNWCEVYPGTEHVVSIDPAHATASDDNFRQTGRRIRNRSDLFPVGTNVNFAHVVNENRLKLVTYERGVEDLTLACGTGAIATAIAREFQKVTEGFYAEHTNKKTELTEHHIQIENPGGPLEVSFEMHHRNRKPLFKNIVLLGPVVSVFHGQIGL